MLVSMGVVGGAVLHGVLNFLLGFCRLVGLVFLVVFSMLGRVLPGKDVYLWFVGAVPVVVVVAVHSGA